MISSFYVSGKNNIATDLLLHLELLFKDVMKCPSHPVHRTFRHENVVIITRYKVAGE